MKSSTSLFLAAVLAFSTPLLANETKPDGPKGFRSGGPDRMLEKLDLSAEQKEKLKSLREARRDKMQGMRKAVQEARKSLKELLAKSGQNQEAALRAKNEEVLTLEQELGRERFESILEIRTILTEEQLKKFVEMEKGRGKWGQREMGKHGKGGPRHKGGDKDKE